jgi:hypothetical protein
MIAVAFGLESCIENISKQHIIFLGFKLEGKILLNGKLFTRFAPELLAGLTGQLGV